MGRAASKALAGRFALALAACAAIAAQAAALGEAGARHLLERAGFGASPAELAAFAPLEPAEAVDRLLEGARREPSVAPPAFVSAPYSPYYKIRELSVEARMEEQRLQRQQAFAL